MPIAESYAAKNRSRLPGWVCFLILLTATLLTHGWSLADGLFFDDHLHLYKLQHLGWTPSDLYEVTKVNPSHFIECWWQTETVQWEYLRPVAVLIYKAWVVWFPEQPVLWHAVSVACHLITAWCIYRLVFLLTQRSGWALAGGYLFVIHPHGIYTVSWLASQNAVLQTTFSLMALLTYIQATGLQLCPHPYITRSQVRAILARPQPWHWGWGWTSLLFWALAVLCRENAIVLPAIVVGLDLAFGGWAQIKRRIPVYAVMGLLTIGYVYWRFAIAYHPYPDFYVRSIDDGVDLLWLAAKFLHYVVGVIFQAPLIFGPTLRGNPWLETPLDMVVMLAIAGFLTVGYLTATWQVRGFWIWPMWIVLSLLPVLPVMATPHNGYMPAVGFCVAVPLAAAMRNRVRQFSLGRWSRVAAGFFLVAITCYFPIYRTMWNSIRASEQLTLHRVQKDPPSEMTSHIFFIDMPFINVYAQLQWAHRNGLANALNHLPNLESAENLAPRWHALTFSNHVMLVDRRIELEQLSSHAFRLEVVEGRPFFSGAMGRFLIDAMRDRKTLPAGPQEEDSEHFDVDVIRVDEEGVWELQFTFHRPLDDPDYTFYIATPLRAATKLTFAGESKGRSVPDGRQRPVTAADLEAWGEAMEQGNYDAGGELIRVAATEQGQIGQAAWERFRRHAVPMAGAAASPLIGTLKQESVKPEEARACLDWWSSQVSPETYAAIVPSDAEAERLRETVGDLLEIRAVAGRIIRVDMYLTGPPFPGP